MDIAAEVARLKREKDAVVLAHYYVPAETQALADYVGDSFYLARLARTLECSTIVLCGVSFMAESAKMLNPERTVLISDTTADCPMAHMVNKADVDEIKSRYDDLAVVCYINSTAEIKSWSDVCVTSSNAVKVVRELPQHNILFIPDMHLGHYVSLQVPEKNFILNKGYCPIHHEVSPAEVDELKAEHPDALVIAHPECPTEVLDRADYIGSTKQMIDFVETSDAQEFIVLTVVGVQREMERVSEGADKRFYFPKTTPICVDMVKITPEKLLACLSEGSGEVSMPVEVERATTPLELMLELAAR